MRFDGKSILLVAALCLLNWGCVSVRYADCSSRCSVPCHDCQLGHSTGSGHALRSHAAKPIEPPLARPMIPPHSKFHPVPTRPVFAQRVFFEGVPQPIPTKAARPVPLPAKSAPVPPTDRLPARESDDTDSSQPPQRLRDELRVASPISLNAPLNPSRTTGVWRARSSRKD